MSYRSQLLFERIFRIVAVIAILVPNVAAAAGSPIGTHGSSQAYYQESGAVTPDLLVDNAEPPAKTPVRQTAEQPTTLTTHSVSANAPQPEEPVAKQAAPSDLLAAPVGAPESKGDTALSLDPSVLNLFMADNDGTDASCSPRGSLLLEIAAPPDGVIAGNEFAPIAGDIYTATVTNNGGTPTELIDFIINPNSGFYYVGSSLTAESSVDGTLGFDINVAGDGGPSQSILFDITGSASETTLDPGEVITFVFQLNTNGEAISGQSLRDL